MNRIDTDVCIIGTGVAGAIIAQKCVEAGRDVLMVDAGRRVNGRSMMLQFWEKVMRDYRIPRMRLWHRASSYQRNDYLSTGNPGYDLGGLALVARGGSTLGWSGDAYRLKPEDFRRYSLTGQGLDWPLSYEELEPYYLKGEKTLRVAGDYLDEGHPPRSKPFPLMARPFDLRDQLFLDLLSELDWSPMHHNISLAPDGGAFTADELCDQLEKHPNFRILTHCVATYIRCSSKQRADALECWNSNLGDYFSIEAKIIVICAGGIETPNLLKQSANEWCPDGLGNHSHHLGCHLISHPGVAIGGALVVLGL
jgi:glucose dehydrogenase